MIYVSKTFKLLTVVYPYATRILTKNNIILILGNAVAFEIPELPHTQAGW